MKKRIKMCKLIAMVIILFMLPSVACTKKNTSVSEVSTVSETKEYIIVDYFVSEAIKNNKINDDARRYFEVFLPASYYDCDKSYPVVYYLHGYNGTTCELNYDAEIALNSELTGSDKEFILVAIDGMNNFGGSFYVNSPILGNSEDYVVKEAVNFVDNNYRTIANADSRGICGFSMGGFGAINLAMLHPDIFSACYAMSPGVIKPGQFKQAFDSWKPMRSFYEAYGQAFCYDEKKPYYILPKFDSTEQDNQIIKRWESGFGNFEEKIKAYKALNCPLKAIGFTYGESETWIADGTQYLSELLTKNNIKNTLVKFKGSHRIPVTAIDGHIVPFFRSNLKWE